MNRLKGHQGVFALGLLMSIVAILAPTYPPMVDLPQHVAAVATMDRILFGSSKFADHYEFTWLTPYWLGYLLVWVAGKLFGFVWGAKVVVAGAMAAFVMTCVRLRRQVRAPALLDLLMLPAPFGFAYYWGFLNFIVAAPLAVLTICEFLRYLDEPRRKLRVVFWLLILLAAHVLALAVVTGVCLVLALRPLDSVRDYLRRISPLLVPVLLLTAWLSVLYVPARNEGGPWQIGWHRVQQLAPNMLSLSLTWPNILISVVLLATPWIHSRPLPTVAKFAPFGFYILFMLFAPNYMMGNYFTYNRFAMFGMPLYALCFARAENSTARSTTRSSLAVFALVTTSILAIQAKTLLSSLSYESEAKGFHTLLGSMKQGVRVLGLIATRHATMTPAPVFWHYQAWYQAERDGVADFNFAYWPIMNLHYRPKTLPAVDEAFLWNPWDFDWQTHAGASYRYFIVKGTEDFINHIAQRFTGHATKIQSEGDWYLYVGHSRADINDLDESRNSPIDSANPIDPIVYGVQEHQEHQEQ